MMAESFHTVLNSFSSEDIRNVLKSNTAKDVRRAIQERRFSRRNFLALLSGAAENILPDILQAAENITRRRFGKVIQLYVPLYLSNECNNICTYCGFSFTNKIPRKTLTAEEIRKEAFYLKQRGFEHVLLVTGESPKNVGMNYFLEALDILIPMFSSVAMEVQPLEEEQYLRLHQKGVYSVVVYQETYLPETYARVHPKGKKSNFAYRLEAPERISRAGIHHCGLGVLLGLADWVTDSFYAATHLDYLQRKYWRTRFSVSFPRIRPAEGVTLESGYISGKKLAQLIAAYRICFPDAELHLSTREPAAFRDRIMPYGITHMSAESRTNPGGYTLQRELEQFETDDHRSLEEIKISVRRNGLEPVMKNWYMSDVRSYG